MNFPSHLIWCFQRSTGQPKAKKVHPTLLNLTPGLSLGPNPLQPFCFLSRPVFTKALCLDLLGLGGGRPCFPEVLINQWLCLLRDARDLSSWITLQSWPFPTTKDILFIVAWPEKSQVSGTYSLLLNSSFQKTYWLELCVFIFFFLET